MRTINHTPRQWRVWRRWLFTIGVLFSSVGAGLFFVGVVLQPLSAAAGLSLGLWGGSLALIALHREGWGLVAGVAAVMPVWWALVHILH